MAYAVRLLGLAIPDIPIGSGIDLHSTVLWDWFQDWHSLEGLSTPPLILSAFLKSTGDRGVRR